MDAILSLPAPVRHSLLAVATILLTWGGTEVVPALENESNLVGALGAAIVGAVISVLTPLVNSYGVGAARARELQTQGNGGIV